jgi:hypothetical protein
MRELEARIREGFWNSRGPNSSRRSNCLFIICEDCRYTRERFSGQDGTLLVLLDMTQLTDR